jgi:hypothetical protein
MNILVSFAEFKDERYFLQAAATLRSLHEDLQQDRRRALVGFQAKVLEARPDDNRIPLLNKEETKALAEAQKKKSYSSSSSAPFNNKPYPFRRNTNTGTFGGFQPQYRTRRRTRAIWRRTRPRRRTWRTSELSATTASSLKRGGR